MPRHESNIRESTSERRQRGSDSHTGRSLQLDRTDRSDSKRQEEELDTSPEGQALGEARRLVGDLLDVGPLEADGPRFVGTAEVTGLDALAGASVEVTVANLSGDWMVDAHITATSGPVTTDRLKVVAHKSGVRFVGAVAIEGLGVLGDLEATVGCSASDPVVTFKGGEVDLTVPKGFESGAAQLGDVTLDLATGDINAADSPARITHPVLGTLTATDLRVVAGQVHASFTLADREVALPRFKGAMSGAVAVQAGRWVDGSIGGEGQLQLSQTVSPEPLPLTWAMPLTSSGLGPLTAKLKNTLAIREYLDLISLEITGDLSARSLEAKGTAELHDLPGLVGRPLATFALDTSGDVRVHVDVVDLEPPEGVPLAYVGQARDLVYDNAQGGFSTDTVNLRVDLPLLGTVDVAASMTNNSLNETVVSLFKEVWIPEGKPLVKGRFEGRAVFDGTKFKEAELPANLSFHLGEERFDDLLTLTARIGSDGAFDFTAGLNAPVTLGSHLQVKTFAANYDHSTKTFTGDAVLSFLEVGAQNTDVTMPLGGGGEQARPLAPGKGRNHGYDVSVGVNPVAGPFVRGVMHLGAPGRLSAAAGRFHVPISALLGQKTASIDVAATGYPLVTGGTFAKNLWTFPTKRTPLARWGVGGLFAEVGAKLDFAFTADNILADLSGRATGVSLRDFALPESTTLTAGLYGGLTARLTGTPQLGLGAFLGTPDLLRLSGGLKMPVAAQMTAAANGRAAVRYQGGELTAEGDNTLDLYFGLGGKLVPYYDLSVLGGAATLAGEAPPLTAVSLIDDHRIARLQLPWGGGLAAPRPAADAIDWELARVDRPPETPAPVEQTFTAQAPGEQTTAPSETPDFGEAAWAALDQSFGGQRWYQVLRGAADLLKLISEAASVSEDQLGEWMGWLNDTIGLHKFTGSFLVGFEAPGGVRGKRGLLSALKSLIFGRRPEDEPDEGPELPVLSATELHPLRVGVGTVGVKRGANPGSLLVVNDPFDGSSLSIVAEASRLELDDEQHAKGGHLAVGVAMGDWGTLAGVALAIQPDMTVSTSFTGARLEVGPALSEGTVAVDGAIDGSLWTTANDADRVALNQTSDLVMPKAIAGMDLEAKAVQVGFVNDGGAWKLGRANTAVVPFGGGAFTGQLDSFDIHEGGIDAAGRFYVDLPILGRAGGAGTIKANRVVEADLGFEAPSIALPPGQSFLTGAIEGGLQIRDGELDNSRVGVVARMHPGDGEAVPLGRIDFTARRVGEQLVTEFEAVLDEGALSQLRLGEIATAKSLSIWKRDGEALGARGTFDASLPSLGQVTGGTLAWGPDTGLEARGKLVLDNSLLQGELKFERAGGRVTLGGKAQVTVGERPPFEAALSYVDEVIDLQVDPNADVLGVTFGDHRVSAMIQALRYDRKSGAWSGTGSVGGTLPMLGAVTGAATLDSAGGGSLIKEASLHAVNPHVAIPSTDPRVTGPVDAQLRYGDAGVTGTVRSSGLTLDVPGLGAGSKLALDARFDPDGPSGTLALEGGADTGGLFQLTKLDAKVGKDGLVTGGGEVAVRAGGEGSEAGTLAAGLREDGFFVAAKNIDIGDPETSPVFAKGVAIGYDSVAGLSLAGDGHVNLGGLRAGLRLRYGGAAGTPAKLDASVDVATTLYEGGSRAPTDLGKLDFTFFVAPIVPGLLSVYARVAVDASLTWTLEPIVLSAKGVAKGVDLHSGTFDSVALAPTLSGGVTATLEGGPSVGLIAALGSPSLASIEGNVGLRVGGSATLAPKLQGLLEYGPDGLQGGAGMSASLFFGAQARPTIGGSVGLFGGRIGYEFPTYQGDEFTLIDPRELFSIDFGMGPLGSRSARDKALSDLIPSNPMAGPRASTADGPDQTTDMSPTKEAPAATANEATTGTPANQQPDTAQGPFSLRSLLPLIQQGLPINDVKGAIESLMAIADKLAGLAGAAVDYASDVLDRTWGWVSSCFGGSYEAAEEAVFSATELHGVPNIDAFDGFAEIAEMQRARARSKRELDEGPSFTEDGTKMAMLGGGMLLAGGAGVAGGVKSMESVDSDNAPYLIAGAIITGVVVGTVMYGAHRRSSEKREDKEHAIEVGGAIDPVLELDAHLIAEGDQPLPRMATIKFIKTMEKHGVGQVLDLFTPKARVSAWDQWSASGSGDALVRALKSPKGQIREVWKTAEVNDLHAIGDFLAHCCGYSDGQIKTLCEDITGTYYSGWLGGDGHTVRRNFEAAGMLAQ